MKNNSTYSRLTSLIVIAGLLALPNFAQAKEFETTGSATYIVTDSVSTIHPNGTKTVTQTSKTILHCDNETVGFHLAPQTVVGTNVLDADGNLLTSAGYGHAVDADGDVMYIWWRMIEGGSVWGFMSGTGKYEGMEGGGTSEVITMTADGSQMIRWNGKWTQK